jgi:hypothetical protein
MPEPLRAAEVSGARPFGKPLVIRLALKFTVLAPLP